MNSKEATVFKAVKCAAHNQGVPGSCWWANLCDQFINGAREAGNEVEKIFLRDWNINFCTGSYYCAGHNGKCAISDDVPLIVDKMVRADVIVLGTPVYFYCMNAQLKTLIDRSVMKYTQITDKDFYLIAAAAEDEATTMDGTLTSFRGYLECLENIREAGLILAKGVWNVGDILGKPYVQQAYGVG